MPPFKQRSRSPITKVRSTIRRVTTSKSLQERLTGVSSESNDRRPCQGIVPLIRTDQFRRLHTPHKRHRHIHLSPKISLFPTKKKKYRLRRKERTRMISKGWHRCVRVLNLSTATDPFSAISTEWPYFCKICVARRWLTSLSSASRMSKVVSPFVAAGLMVLDSRADANAEARSC